MRAAQCSCELVVFALLVVPSLSPASPLQVSSAEKKALVGLGERLPQGRLLWVRSGQIYWADGPEFTARRASVGEVEASGPRWSPDGQRILFNDFDGIYLMDADFGNKKLVIPAGSTASWTRDGAAITAVAGDGYRVVRYGLGSGKTETLYDARDTGYNGQPVSQAAELRRGGRFLLVFRLTPEHTTEIVDLQQMRYIANEQMERGDCSPAWAPDGSYIVNTARTGSRPVLRATFDAQNGQVSSSTHLVGLSTSEKYYIHGQRVSNDGNWIAFGGKVFGGSLEAARREIYIWRIGEAESAAVRITFDTEEDEEPSLHVGPSDPGPAPEPRPAPDAGPTPAPEPSPEPELRPDSALQPKPEPGSDATLKSDLELGSEPGSAADAGGSATNRGLVTATEPAGGQPGLSGGCELPSSGAPTEAVCVLVVLLLYLPRRRSTAGKRR